MTVVPNWIRPPGPLNVWKVVDGYETLPDGTRKAVKFSIQDVPNDENRRQEVLDHLHKYFLADEPCCKSLRIADSDPVAAQDFEMQWKYSLDQDAVVACYKLDSDGKIKNLVAANLLFFKTPQNMKDFDRMEKLMKSPNYVKIIHLCDYLSSKADICKTYKVDRYIGSISLSVMPAFRGQKLGAHILNARSLLAEKYGFSVTATFFSSHASQLQAERAGFEECVSVEYKEFVDDKGNPMFPNIESKYAKMMAKRLP